MAGWLCIVGLPSGELTQGRKTALTWVCDCHPPQGTMQRLRRSWCCCCMVCMPQSGYLERQVDGGTSKQNKGQYLPYREVSVSNSPTVFHCSCFREMTIFWVKFSPNTVSSRRKIWASFSVLLGMKEWERGDSMKYCFLHKRLAPRSDSTECKELLQQASYHCCGCWHILERSCCYCCTLCYHLEAGQEQ